MLRYRVKAVAERLLLVGGPARLVRRQGVLVLAYYNVVPDDAAPAGEPSLHLPLSRFREQLDLLVASHHCVGVGEVLAGDEAARRGNLRRRLSERRHAGGTGACPQRDPGHDFRRPWVRRRRHVLVGPDREARNAAELREHALGPLREGRDRILELAAASGQGLQPVPDHHACASEAQFGAAVTNRAITLGSHSWSHVNLTGLGGAEVRAERAAAAMAAGAVLGGGALAHLSVWPALRDAVPRLLSEFRFKPIAEQVLAPA